MRPSEYLQSLPRGATLNDDAALLTKFFTMSEAWEGLASWKVMLGIARRGDVLRKPAVGELLRGLFGLPEIAGIPGVPDLKAIRYLFAFTPGMADGHQGSFSHGVAVHYAGEAVDIVSHDPNPVSMEARASVAQAAKCAANLQVKMPEDPATMERRLGFILHFASKALRCGYGTPIGDSRASAVLTRLVRRHIPNPFIRHEAA